MFSNGNKHNYNLNQTLSLIGRDMSKINTLLFLTLSVQIIYPKMHF